MTEHPDERLTPKEFGHVDFAKVYGFLCYYCIRRRRLHLDGCTLRKWAAGVGRRCIYRSTCCAFIALPNRALLNCPLLLQLLPTMDRRTFVATAVSSLTASQSTARRPRLIAPRAAYEAARSGRMLLIDIRTPREWCETGITKVAHPLDMHGRHFRSKLLRLAGGHQERSIGLICTSGARSDALAEALFRTGWQNVGDVQGGMSGSWLHNGWIDLGLPVRKFCPLADKV